MRMTLTLPRFAFRTPKDLVPANIGGLMLINDTKNLITLGEPMLYNSHEWVIRANQRGPNVPDN